MLPSGTLSYIRHIFLYESNCKFWETELGQLVVMKITIILKIGEEIILNINYLRTTRKNCNYSEKKQSELKKKII